MHAFLNTANSIAREAGKIILRGFDRLNDITTQKKGKNDFVSEIDIASENYIINALREAYPDHGFLAEESGNHDVAQQKTSHRWIIDPLDGTANFLHGFPHFAISMALEINGKIEHGLIYDPLRDEVFSASKGDGARLNQTRLRVSTEKNIANAMIATGFPFKTEQQGYDDFMQVFATVLPSCAGMRRPGAAALDLAYTAAGRIDAYFEFGTKIWDIAAGALIVREAGGFVSDFVGGENFLTSGNIMAGNPKIYKALAQTIGPVLPERWKQ